MFSPMDTVPASRAPWFAASMMPGPPPVIMANFSSPSRRAVSTARPYHGLAALGRAEPKIATAHSTSESSSNPATNSPVMRSTRHGAVWVKARRSRIGRGSNSRSSSVRRFPMDRPASAGEDFDRRDIVLEQVVEEGGQPNVTWAGVGHDAGVSQAADRSRRIISRDHDDRRPQL